MRYPRARRQRLVEVLHGQPVADPYRWLEDAGSPETGRWLQEQDELWLASTADPLAFMAGELGLQMASPRPQQRETGGGLR